MNNFERQKQIEAEVDELFERSDKVIHDIFNVVLERIRLDYETNQNENNRTNSEDKETIAPQR